MSRPSKKVKLGAAELDGGFLRAVLPMVGSVDTLDALGKRKEFRVLMQGGDVRGFLAAFRESHRAGMARLLSWAGVRVASACCVLCFVC